MLIYNKKSNILFCQILNNQYLYGVKQKHHNMLPSKDTTILSEINNFFTSSEKAINERIWLIILAIMMELAIVFEADTEIIMEKLMGVRQINC